MASTREYQAAWRVKNPGRTAFYNAQSRCNNADHPLFPNYGGRGIELRLTIEEWLEELGPRPTEEHSVDRIDNDGHYERGNIRWATATEQANNQRPRSRHCETCTCESVGGR